MKINTELAQNCFLLANRNNRVRFITFLILFFVFQYSGYAADLITWSTDITQPSDTSTNQNPTSVTTFNGSIYYIYVNPARQMVVAKKTGNTVVKDTVFNLEMGLDEKYHVCPVIGVDKKGYIHIAGDMHNDGWKYFKTNKPEDISSWSRRYDLPGVGVTYPNFFYDKNREMYICFRHRKDDGTGGNQRVGLMKYNTENSTFTMLGGISYTEKDGTSATTKTMGWGNGWGGNDCWYIKPGHRVYFDNNNRMHFICTLINVCLGTFASTDVYSPSLMRGGYESNTHILYAYSDDLGTSWHKIDSSLITSLPLTVDNATIALDRTANHDIIGGECELGAFDTNHPIISYKLFSDNTLHSLRWNGTSWVEITLPGGRSTNIFMSRGNGYSAWYNGSYIDYTKDGINWTSQCGTPTQFPKGLNGVGATGLDREYFKQTGNFRYLGTFNYYTTTSIFTLKSNIGNSSNVVPTSVSLSPATTTISVGVLKQLTATIIPSNSTNTNLIWSSSDASVASVDAYGVITAQKCGTATITVTTQDGSKTATCVVTVTGGGAVSSVSLSKTSLSITKSGLPQQISAYVLPTNACNSTVSWSTSNAAVATVNEIGQISGVEVGNCVITCKTSDGNKTATCNVTVTQGLNLITNGEFDNGKTDWTLVASYPAVGTFDVVTGAALSGTNAACVTVSSIKTAATDISLRHNFPIQNGKTYCISFQAKALSAQKIYVGISNNWTQTSVNLTTSVKKYSYQFTADNTNNTTYLVFGLGYNPNTVYIDNVYISEVGGVDVTGVVLNQTSSTMLVGDNLQLIPTVTPSNADVQTVTWSSSNPFVANVDDQGKVTAIADGMATITATTIDGYYTATCTISVTSINVSVTDINVSPSTATLTTGRSIQLSTTITPANASNQNINWSSGNTSVATVSSSGLVTAVALGSTAITATTQDGNKSSYCGVVVSNNSTVLTSQTPSGTGTDGPYDLGMKFKSSQSGVISKIRYYKPATETGAHTGRIWSDTGTQLATSAFTNESASGWQETVLATPLNITANTTYVVAVNSNSAYAQSSSGFLSVVSNGSLSTVADGKNGIYGNVGVFPTNFYSSTNYFRDVYFGVLPIISSVNDTSLEADIKMYPNPNSGNQFFIQLNKSVLVDNTLITITDLSARIIYQKEINVIENIDGRISVTPHITAKGIYLIRVSSNDFVTKTLKLIIH